MPACFINNRVSWGSCTYRSKTFRTFMSCSEMRSRLTLSDSDSNSTRLMLLNSTSVEITLSLWLMTWLIPYLAPTSRLTNTSLSWSWVEERVQKGKKGEREGTPLSDKLAIQSSFSQSTSACALTIIVAVYDRPPYEISSPSWVR